MTAPFSPSPVGAWQMTIVPTPKEAADGMRPSTALATFTSDGLVTVIEQDSTAVGAWRWEPGQVITGRVRALASDESELWAQSDEEPWDEEADAPSPPPEIKQLVNQTSFRLELTDADTLTGTADFVLLDTDGADIDEDRAEGLGVKATRF